MEVGFNPIPGPLTGSNNGFGSQELGRFEFLRLLVAQLSNQNPLEPVSNNEFIGQLAQFSSLDELVKIRELNETSLAVLIELILAGSPEAEDPAEGDGSQEVAEPTPVDDPAA